MTESTRTSSRHSSRSGNSFYKSNTYLTYLRPAIYFAFAILFIVAARIFHGGSRVALLGALSIMILTISEIRKIQFGVFLSMVSLVVMVMVNLWNWADQYFIEIFSGNLAVDKTVFPKGLCEGLIALAAIWLYHKLLKSLKLRVTHEWYVKKSQLKFLVLLFFFQLSLILFWITGYVVHTVEAGSHYDQHDATLVSGVIALLAAGIPALIYFFSNSDQKKRHSHRHSHHHHDDE